ncbi:Cold-active serine alkaline protease [Pseudoalteromonas luteoviolacea B = ATCC 29581]|nr:Cold-active serine alkaline protease [Pseudoalteromonas luteoviolacea B = ATCC 29581]
MKFPLTLAAAAISLSSQASEPLRSQTTELTEAQMLKYTQHAQKITVGTMTEVNLPFISQAHVTHANVVNTPITHTITHPGASYIKVHFKDVDLSKGGKLIIASPDGSERYEVTEQNRKAASIDTRIGDDGVSQFAAMSITGETAVVTFEPGAKQTHFGQIDFYYHGDENASSVEPEAVDNAGLFSTCGAMERKDVQCWAQTHPTEFERTRPVARLLIGGSSLCTAWRVGPDNRLFTNNHCVESAQELGATEVWFNYQNTQCNGSTRETIVKVTGNTLLKTDYTLDYTLFTINDFAKAAPFGYFGLDVRDATQGERIYIPQHGSGNPKELSIESDQDSNGLCSVNQANANGRGTGTDLGYYCDTIGGSSGSPVLAAQTNKVIALHHLGGCTNKGAKISLIWPQVASHFNNQIPEGDNGSNNPLPVANFSYSCSGLNCQFDSTASTGTIQSRQWLFGDGQQDVGSIISHNYSNAGSYTVSLTVTDDKGQSVTNSQNINVGSVDEKLLQKGVAKTGLSAVKGDTIHYYFDLPAGASNATVKLSGGSGDADLYVRFGAEPTTGTFDCRPYRWGNAETCNLTKGAGRYYIMLRAYDAFNGVQVVADHQ